jgi:Tat protein secretion system quality control protein TatD with DNase activity
MLIETDAPDMMPPENVISFHHAPVETGKPINHPANLRCVFNHFADHLKYDPINLEKQITENFIRFFLSKHRPNH